MNNQISSQNNLNVNKRPSDLSSSKNPNNNQSKNNANMNFSNSFNKTQYNPNQKNFTINSKLNDNKHIIAQKKKKLNLNNKINAYVKNSDLNTSNVSIISKMSNISKEIFFWNTKFNSHTI